MARSGHYLRNLVSQAVSDSRTATGRLTTEIEQPHVFRSRIVSQAERTLPVRSTVQPPIVTLLMPKLLCFIIADTNAHLLNTGDDIKPTPQIIPHRPKYTQTRHREYIRNKETKPC